MERPVARRAFLGAVPGLLALAARPARGQDVHPGVWCGAVTASGATVNVLAGGAGVPVELELTDGASPPVRRAQPTPAPAGARRSRRPQGSMRCGFAGDSPPRS